MTLGHGAPAYEAARGKGSGDLQEHYTALHSGARGLVHTVVIAIVRVENVSQNPLQQCLVPQCGRCLWLWGVFGPERRPLQVGVRRLRGQRRVKGEGRKEGEEWLTSSR